jgi:hypothetical protein
MRPPTPSCWARGKRPWKPRRIVSTSKNAEIAETNKRMLADAKRDEQATEPNQEQGHAEGCSSAVN